MSAPREISLAGPFCQLLISEYGAQGGGAAPDEEMSRAKGAGGVLLCPPHPGFGGTRHDARLVMTAEHLRARGITAWCLDYSGYHRGEREVAEALAALEELAPRVARIGLMGYSYGAVVASLAASQTPAPLAALALLALPPGVDTMVSNVSAACPKLFVGGLGDDIASAESLASLFNQAPEPKEKLIVDDGHFFEIHAAEVAARIGDFFLSHLLPKGVS